MKQTMSPSATDGIQTATNDRKTVGDETMIASLEARIAAAMAMASDASSAGSSADDNLRLLNQDRRDRVERFADHQLALLAEVCRRIDAGDPPSAERLHQQLMQSFAKAKAEGYAADWEHSAYPLAVTIDECLLELSWPGQRWWEDHVLESTLFGTRVGSQRFFELASQLKVARSHPIGPTLLRVYHECVAIGFRGLYATSTPAALAGPLGLPASLSQWRIALHRAMWQWAQEIEGPPRPDASRRRNIPGAPPLRYHLAMWILGGGVVLLLAVNALVWSGMGR